MAVESVKKSTEGGQLNDSVLEAVDMGDQWLIVYSNEDNHHIEHFIKKIQLQASLMSIKMGEPRKVQLALAITSKLTTNYYLKTILNHSSFGDKIIFVVMPGMVDNCRFLELIRSFCTLKLSKPVQFFRGSLLAQPRKLESLIPNLLLEMTCKMGGAPWGIQMALPAVMYVGIDVYINQKNLTKLPVMGFVASMNSNATAWYSKVDVKEKNEEEMDAWKQHLCNEWLIESISDALYKYKSINNRLPAYIFIYRKKDKNVPLEKLVSVEYLMLEKTIKNIYHLDAIINGKVSDDNMMF